MNNKPFKAIFLILLILNILSCSSLQRLPHRTPNNYSDASLIVPDVDLSAYRVILPSVSDASVRFSDDAGEIIAPLRSGQPAPFAGVLFNGPAVARVEVEFRGQREQCRINSQADLDRMAARSIADIALLQTTINTLTETYLLRLRTQEAELNQVYNLTRINTPTSPWLYVGLGVGGFALGLLTSLLIYVGIGR